MRGSRRLSDAAPPAHTRPPQALACEWNEAFVEGLKVPAGAEQDPRSLRVVLDALLPPQPAAVTDAGLLLLMVTPVVSVGISAVAFAVRRDWLYVALAGFVFTMLMVGFAIGRA